MQDREETSSQKRSDAGPDTPISGSTTAGISSSDRMLNSKVTGCIDGTIHHPDNTFSIDWTLAANRPDTGLQRSIEYREVLEQ